MTNPSLCKRLIEVDLPIAAVSAQSVREKSLRHGHISTLHLWWARRPLASCRAVLLASLWPDPADPLCPERFREKARAELSTLFGRRSLKDPLTLRRTLLEFIGVFSNWDVVANDTYLRIARTLVQEAHEALGGVPGTAPVVVDPFAGGGAIPLEALRVGAEAVASDLNAVAVLINRMQIEQIPRHGPALAASLRAWGAWVKHEAAKVLDPLYPADPDGALPIAWLWARTVLCEGPGCGAEIPLIRSTAVNRHRPPAHVVVGQKKNPIPIEVVRRAEPDGASTATGKGGKATCPACGFTTSANAVKSQLRKRHGGADDARLFAVVIDRASSGRDLRAPTDGDHAAIKKAVALALSLDEEVPKTPLNPTRPAPNTRGTSGVAPIGISRVCDLPTARQKVALVTLVRTCRKARDEIAKSGDREFGAALEVLLAFAVSRMVNQHSSLSRWHATGSKVEGLYSKPALQVMWDFAEGAPLGDTSGNWDGAVEWIARVVKHCAKLPSSKGSVAREDATARSTAQEESVDMLFTDPPYFAAIPYSDISDVFYAWLRQSVGDRFPELFRDLSPDRTRELIVTNSAKGADGVVKDADFFRRGMCHALTHSRVATRYGGIGCVVFADSSAQSWESLLAAVIDAGWVVTASWPIHTEMQNRTRAQNSASLQSSIFLVCRPREKPDGSLREDEVGDWFSVLGELPQKIAPWMKRLREEGIAGADAIFACIGPALEIFSRYSRVEKTSGDVVRLGEYLESVWAEVSRCALSTLFAGADTSAFEADARLTAVWLWTLQASRAPGAIEADEGDGEEVADEGGDDGEDDEEAAASGASTKKKAPKGYTLEYDAALHIAMGLGARFEDLTTLVEVNKGEARLKAVSERAEALFPKQVTVQTTTAARTAKSGQGAFGFVAKEDEARKARIELGPPIARGTLLDRVHQAMLLFHHNRTVALKELLVDRGHGKAAAFWTLADSLAALYPDGSEEKRMVVGLIARRNGLGL